MADKQSKSEQMGQHSKEHEKLEPFAGTFSAVVKIWMGEGEPNIVTGTMINDWVLGGRYLRQTFLGDTMGGNHGAFEGIGFWGYDTSKGEYQGFWIDNASTIMQMESGSVDDTGKVWTMLSSMRNPGDGSTMNKRTVITLEDNDHHKMESFFADGEGNEFKAMELNYTRKS